MTSRRISRRGLDGLWKNPGAVWALLGVWACLIRGIGAEARADDTVPALGDRAEQAQQRPLEPALEPALAAVLRRKDGRVTTQVLLNGRGPYAFIIDTGANRSSISALLARDLALPEAVARKVNGVTGAELRAAVRAESLSVGSLKTGVLEMPVIEPVALGNSAGLLAANELKRHRVVLDFTRNRYEVSNSRAGFPTGSVRLRARLRFGHLVETPCRIGRIMARCIIDTGAEYTLINEAMLEKLRPDKRTIVVAENTEVFGATAGVITGAVVRLPPIKLDELQFVQSAALAVDAHVFAVWGLSDTPAVVLGMNVLRACDLIAIDFPQKALYVRLSP